MFANFGIHLLVARVHVYAHTGRFELIRHFLRVRCVPLADGYHDCLHGRQPDRKGAGVVLDQHAEEALH